MKLKDLEEGRQFIVPSEDAQTNRVYIKLYQADYPSKSGIVTVIALGDNSVTYLHENIEILT